MVSEARWDPPFFLLPCLSLFLLIFRHFPSLSLSFLLVFQHFLALSHGSESHWSLFSSCVRSSWTASCFSTLGEDNYHSWARSMEMALDSKRKFGFFDGSIPRPPLDAAPALREAWNAIASSWLSNYVSKDIATSVICFDSAAMIWNDLKVHFRQYNGPRLFQLRKDLVSIS